MELTVLDLPKCRHRGPGRPDGRYPCRSPKVVTRTGSVAPATCLECPYADHPPAALPAPPRVVVRRPPPVPCAHRGDDLTGAEKGRLSLPLHKNWAPCGKGHGRGGYACACEGCGPSCRDYVPDPEHPDAPAAPAPLAARAPVVDRFPPLPAVVPVSGPVRLDVSANGIGDHLTGLAVANGWRAANPGRHLTLTVRPHVADWVRLFDGYDDLKTYKNRLLPDVWPAGFSRGDKHFVEAAAAAPWWRRPELRPLPAAAAAWADGYRGAVVLAPFSLGSGTGRNWLESHWRALEADLRALGRRVVTVGAGAEAGRLKAFAEPLAGRDPAEVAALFRASALVIANESGMAHLAGALGCPVLVLAAQLDGQAIHGRWPHSEVLQGPLGCSGCRWTGPEFRAACHTVCASLQAIPPERVLAASRRYLDCEWFADPLLRGHLGKLLIPPPPGHPGPPPDRRGTVGAFLKALERSAAPLVVETGCQREALDYGAGMSSTLFGLFLKTHGGRLVSLDLDAANVVTCRREAAGLPVEVVHTDSRPWLAAYAGPPIAGLYLDSCDTWVPEHAEVCRTEAENALAHLAPDAPVLVDDTWADGAGGWAGKGRLAVPFLLSRGFRVARTQHQTLLVRND